MNLKIELAEQFINSTANHLFLTGKAGTGKTTFLRKLSEISHKSFLVIAPTGVAALNAGGVTIHSQFLLPFGTFIAQEELEIPPSIASNFYHGKTIARRNPLDARRRKVLQSIDLLVIDEVSMCRADIIDAIDYRLRSVRRNRRPFGGVQLLMIGDLFQLPPIVKDHEWAILSKLYPSPHFFEALALKNSSFTYLELDKIYRQNDPEFIDLLNKLRNNNCGVEDLHKLNQCYQPNYKPEKGLITLVTHNHQANSINSDRLKNLDAKSFYYKSKVEGEFNENLFPMPETLELKKGAQVMFIKNDTEGNRFYNGKIAIVSDITKENIFVDLDGEDFEVPRVKWENRRFEMDAKKQEIEDKILGSFEHYPLRLAWAVTIHKSQGLTFEKAVIDVGSAFAAGQVYVALSRLTSLKGLILKTKVQASAIMTDGQVQAFVKVRGQNNLEEDLGLARKQYLQETVLESFSMMNLLGTATYQFQKHHEKFNFQVDLLNDSPKKIQDQLTTLAKTGDTFQRQLYSLLQSEDFTQIEERLEKGANYFLKELLGLIDISLVNLRILDMHTGTKALNDLYQEILSLLVKRYFVIQEIKSFYEYLLHKGALPKSREGAKEELLIDRKAKAAELVKGMQLNLKTKSGKVKKPTGQTYSETFELIDKGLSALQIADQRKLKASTIYGHLLKGIKDDKLKVEQVFETAKLAILEKIWKSQKSPDLMNLHYADKSFSIAEWRIAMHYFRSQEEKPQ
jgi:DNA-binding NarL/FixJ family response regulator